MLCEIVDTSIPKMCLPRFRDQKSKRLLAEPNVQQKHRGKKKRQPKCRLFDSLCKQQFESQETLSDFERSFGIFIIVHPLLDNPGLSEAQARNIEDSSIDYKLYSTEHSDFQST